ncbi:peroxisomal acyl-coenzyme A oxidase 1-like [Styela clava]
MADTSDETKLIMEERRRMDIKVEEITNVIDGGSNNTTLRRKITDMIQNDAILSDMDQFYKTEEEKYSRGIRRALRVRKLDVDFNDTTTQRILFIATGKEIGLPIHSGVFVPTIMNLGNQEQVEKWVPLAVNFNIIGTYAQTELGHGTNLRGLETTATFIPESQEFVVNTPKLSSMKWWPGDLGKAANHAVVMAQLIIKGESYGMMPFIVQIRDLSTHLPLPGVKVGDIGAKFAFESNDNGFLILDNVRIPKENMLSGVAEVDAEGNFMLKSDPRVLYGGMMLIRVNLVDSQAVFPLQQACTIATRYSIVRRQGSIQSGGDEVSILDYVAQQHKLFPLLAASYAFHFSSRQTHELYKIINAEVKNGEFSNLPELHALTAGMKAYLTEKCLAGTDICRRACGGHGYLQASGFPNIYLQQLASVTYEGENTVMFLQCARYLMKCMSGVINGRKIVGIPSYLNERMSDRCHATSERDLTNHDTLLQCLKHRSSFLIRQAKEKIDSLTKSGKSYQDVWNITSVELVNVARAHLEYYIFSSFLQVIQNMNASADTKGKMGELCSLFGLHTINENMADLLRDKYLSAKQARLATEAELSSLSRIRKYALGLVDAFDFTDKTLMTCIGTYDGNAYERLYENAKRAPRNKTEVNEGFYNQLRPYLLKGRDILEGTKSKL